MPIDMSDFKMIYKDKIYNCLSMMPFIEHFAGQPGAEKSEINSIEVIFIDEDNRINVINDKASMFQFVRK